MNKKEKFEVGEMFLSNDSRSRMSDEVQCILEKIPDNSDVVISISAIKLKLTGGDYKKGVDKK